MINNKKILLFIKLPPPSTGATFINNCVNESKLLHETYNLKTIRISYAKQVEDLGKINIHKIVIFFNTFFILFYQLIVYKPAFIYFQITPTKAAFLRDSIYVLLIKAFRKTILFHLHGQGIKKEASNSKIKKRLYQFILSNSHIICLSNLLKKDIENVFNGTVHIVNNAIVKKNNFIFPIDKNENISILFLSNLIIKKGIYDFIEALKILNNKKTKFKAEIVGDEKDISKMKLLNTIHEKSLSDKIKYLGPKFEHEKEKIYLRSHIFLHPTHDDAFPIVLLEAMQAGLPVISTFEGAIPEIVDDGITGFLVEKHNPQALADKIEILINNRELREQMGRAGRKKFLEKYTMDVFEQNMKQVFDQVLQDIN